MVQKQVGRSDSFADLSFGRAPQVQDQALSPAVNEPERVGSKLAGFPLGEAFHLEIADARFQSLESDRRKCHFLTLQRQFLRFSSADTHYGKVDHRARFPGEGPFNFF